MALLLSFGINVLVMGSVNGKGLSGGKGGYASGIVDLFKKVRVVISAEYSIH